MAKEKKTYEDWHYRGEINVIINLGKEYTKWVRGYSMNSHGGDSLYPWTTKERAQRFSEERGYVARFYEEKEE